MRSVGMKQCSRFRTSADGVMETAFETRFGYYEFLIVFSEHQLLVVFVDLVDHGLR